MHTYVAHGKIYERKAKMKVETRVSFGGKMIYLWTTFEVWNNEQKFDMKANLMKSSWNIYWLLY